MSVTRSRRAAPSLDASGTVASDEHASVIADAKNAQGIIVFGYAMRKIPLCADLIMTRHADSAKMSATRRAARPSSPSPR